MLYGATPFEQDQAQAARLRPVMTLVEDHQRARAASRRAGGYGARRRAADLDRRGRYGLCRWMAIRVRRHRHADHGRWQMTRLIGWVSMDMLTVDLTDLPAQASVVGSSWGRNVSASVAWRLRQHSVPAVLQPQAGARLYSGASRQVEQLHLQCCKY